MLTKKCPPWVAAGGGRSAANGKQLQTNNTAVRVYAQSRAVGAVHDSVFVKHVRSSRHMLQKPRAWCFDVQSLLDAQRAGATHVELHDIDTHIVYSASIATINKHGFVIDRGHGRQIALPLHFFNTRYEREQRVEQLALFS